MKAVVVYDSLYGNTEKIAKAIGGAVGDEAKVVRAGDVSLSELESVDLLVVGSPTQGGRPTTATQELLKKVSESAVRGVNVAAFDTRVTARWAAIFGYAAGRIAKSLKRKGGTLVVPPEGFFVEGTEGPLKDGELERAGAWGKSVVRK